MANVKAATVKPTTKINSKWSRLRQIASDQPKEVDSALTEVADALGTMADSLTNLRGHLDLISAPKEASLRVRVATDRKYAASFRRMAEEAPEVIADAISEVYHSLDDVAGALETLSENLGIDLNLSPAEEAFAEEGIEESEGNYPEEEEEAPVVEEEEEFEFKEASGSDAFVSDREDSEPKAPVLASKKKADGGAGFVTNRGKDSKPERPETLKIPQAKGESEVNKVSAARVKVRQRIAKRYGIQL